MTDLFTDPSQVAARLQQLQAQMGDLVRSMTLAQQAGNQAALDQFKPQFLELSHQLAALRVQANQADTPSSTMLALDSFSSAVIEAGKRLGADVDRTLTGASLLVKWLPVIVILAVVVIGIGLYKGSLRASLRK